MADDEARERARRRLEERQARMRGEVPSTSGVPEPASPSRSRPSHPGAGSRRPADASVPKAPFALVDAAMNAVHTLGPKRIAIGCVAAVLLIVAIFGIRGCMAANAASPVPDDADQAPAEQQTPRDSPDEAALTAVLGDELTAQLVQAAEGSDDAAWIAAHPGAYTVDGSEVQRKLLKLAATEPESLPFVRAFPERYPSNAGEPSGGEKSQGGAPLLYQWDQRWGSTVYSSTAFALTGCCPTSLAMVYQGLTGKTDLSPYDMGVRANEGGYETEFDGTDALFLLNEAPALGLSCTQIDVDADALAAALADGGLVICNVGPGDFTEAGHFFVISGLNDDGTLTINDPYSAVRSAKAWDASQVLGQTLSLFAYRLA